MQRVDACVISKVKLPKVPSSGSTVEELTIPV